MVDSQKTGGQPQMATLNKMKISPDNVSSQKSGLIKLFFLIVLSALLILAVKPKQLDAYKTFDQLQFADAELARCVKEYAEANNWTDVGNVTTLRCNNPSGDGIGRLEGIEHLIELNEINLAFNRISDAGPLASLVRLESVDLSHNRLSQLPEFRFAPNIKRIEANYNRIESLDWLTTQHFSGLQSLSIAHNYISDLSKLSSLESISELVISDNHISDLTPVYELQNLSMLDAGNNQIEDLSEIGKLSKLRRLFVDRNKVSQLNGIEGLHSLEELDVANNLLTSVAPIHELERLQRANLNSTGITDLDGMLGLGNLESLTMTNNPDLECADIAEAIQEYGPAAIRSDKLCVAASK